MTATPTRRRVLALGLRHGARMSAAAALPALALPARAAPVRARELELHHLHTREHIDIVYARDGAYLPEALRSLDSFLRDHYSGVVGRIDPKLHDLMHALRQALGTDRPFDVVSGYRAPATNAHLKSTRGGGVATRSLHMEGRAIDLRIPGVPLVDLRDAALELKAGGVGYYPRDGFVHVDTGRVRRW